MRLGQHGTSTEPAPAPAALKPVWLRADFSIEHGDWFHY
jgi:hypothetical protein